MCPRRLDRSLGPAVVALVCVFGLFEFTTIDLAVQDWFFDPGSGRWLVDRDSPWPRLLFYTAPKYVIAAVALAVGLIAWRARARPTRRLALIAVLTIISVPLSVGWIKDATNVFCPWDITRYGGTVPYVRVLEKYPPGQRPAGRGRGFPAGHASGGFALLGLAGLARSRRGQWLALGAGVSCGALMGVYQMAKGAHYLSHTLVTLFFAWIVFLLWRRLLRVASGHGVPAVEIRTTEAFTEVDEPEPCAVLR